MYFTTPEQGAVFEEFVAARKRDGLDMTLMDGAEVRRLVPPIREDVLGASYRCADHPDLGRHPPLYLRPGAGHR